jgi:thioredoxin reductase (NADPH)
MKLPFIILVDDDVQTLGAIQRDIRNRYRNEYRIAGTESANEAIALLKELKLKGEAVALIISDQRMPEMDGVEFLEIAKGIFPETKRMLLTAYSDTDAAIKAINAVNLSYYLLKPWHPPEEKMYPITDDLLDEWHATFKPDHEGIKVIGYQWSAKSHSLKEFLSGNLVPYTWLDAEENQEAEKLIISANSSHDELPLVVLKDGTALKDPSLADVASRVGLQQKAKQAMYDVAIIGAGPAGLAASVYGSCEGLKTLLIERSNPGGQAGSSTRIENYLGFPAGISGAELTRRAIAQTLRFGTEMLTPQSVKCIRIKDGYKIIEMDDGTIAHAKTVVISTGVAYNKLPVEGLDRFTGAGVYYGSASVEAHACRNRVVYIVGGGNSACQAALGLCPIAKEIHIIIRREFLKQTAADYLVRNISKTPNIFVHGSTELIGASGNKILENITLKNVITHEEKILPASALFIYIGSKPATQWLKNIVLTDEKGYILTGNELVKQKNFHTFWKVNRQPYLPEASIPGIFASGDVRFNALTGISSAVGEGAMAIRFVRKYLQEN